MWRELVQAVCSDCTFEAPASEAVLGELEAALGIALPARLRALWLETNGIRKKWGEGLWSAEQAIRDNIQFREAAGLDDLYMTFESCLFFADPGNGDQFFFPIQADSGIHRPDIFLWDHETDSRVWVASNLQRFVEQWFGDRLPDWRGV